MNNQFSPLFERIRVGFATGERKPVEKRAEVVIHRYCSEGFGKQCSFGHAQSKKPAHDCSNKSRGSSG